MPESTVSYDAGSWRLGDDGCIHRRGRMRYATGDVYEGEWVNGKRHGKGMLRLADGSSYLGDFDSNFYHGFGLLTIAKSQHPLTKKWTRGAKYEGEFQKGKRHGKGRGTTSQGDTYDGEYAWDLYHGRGVCAYADGQVYDGQWVRGQWHGDGELRKQDGSSYRGELRTGVFHGYGKFSFGSGGKHGSYAGDYRFGLRHGKGVRVFGDGKRYEGDWKEDTMDGVGLLECEAFKYVGEFANGKFHGHGVVSYATGDAYEGTFDQGAMDGQGTYVYEDGGKYEGQYRQGLKHGRGKRLFSRGDVYDGEWQEDAMHGHGVLERTIQLKKSDGGAHATYRYDGDFCQGQQTGHAAVSYLFTPANEESVFEWKDEYEFPMGSGFWHCGRGVSTYVGQVDRGAFHGHGELRSPDGRRWCGQWRQGKLHGKASCVYLPLIHDHLVDNDKLPVDMKKKQMVRAMGLYRLVRYDGEFVDNLRHGKGRVLFENGDSIDGNFHKGFADGMVVYKFFTGKERYAEYTRGERTRWLSDQEQVELTSSQPEAEADRVTTQAAVVLRALIA